MRRMPLVPLARGRNVIAITVHADTAGAGDTSYDVDTVDEGVAYTSAVVTRAQTSSGDGGGGSAAAATAAAARRQHRQTRHGVGRSEPDAVYLIHVYVGGGGRVSPCVPFTPHS